MRYRDGELRIPEDVVVRSVKEDLVIVDLNRGEYYSLNETGRVVWEALDESADMEQLVDRLEARFSGDRLEIRKDVEILLDELLGRGLLAFDAI